MQVCRGQDLVSIWSYAPCKQGENGTGCGSSTHRCMSPLLFDFACRSFVGLNVYNTGCLQTCYSMHNLAKLVHLDITSNNIMIADNPQGRLRLIDFGFSQSTPSGEAVLEMPDTIAGFRCRLAAQCNKSPKGISTISHAHAWVQNHTSSVASCLCQAMALLDKRMHVQACCLLKCVVCFCRHGQS